MYLRSRTATALLLGLVLAAVALAYWPGMSGGFVFDDFPNLVNNKRTQIDELEWTQLKQAALASDSSIFRRPLAMLSLSLQRYFTGLDPFPMKAANLSLHLGNTLLVFLLLSGLLRTASIRWGERHIVRPTTLALLVAAGWGLAPINLTGVLFVIQRMESLAAFFTLVGLLAYVHGRQRLAAGRQSGLAWMWGGVAGGTTIGILAKETAVMLPVYAILIEWLFFSFGRPRTGERWMIGGLFLATLILPGLAGLAWLLPNIVSNVELSNRPFDLFQRLWTQGRVLWHYIAWTILPSPGSLSLYHDAFPVSRGPLTPWTTLPAALGLASLAALAVAVRRRLRSVSFGILWFFVMHLLVSTVLNLELVYEHRNYLSSAGLILAFFSALLHARWLKWPSARQCAVVAVIMLYGFLTFVRASEWSHPVEHAYFEASHNPESPRAAYTFALMLLIDNPEPGTRRFVLAKTTLQKAAELENAGLLPLQGLIRLHAGSDLPVPSAWWEDMRTYVAHHNLTSQDINALYKVLEPLVKGKTPYPPEEIESILQEAVNHHPGNAILLTMQANFLLNVTGDYQQAERLLDKAMKMRPNDPAMWRNLIDYQLTTNQLDAAESSIQRLKSIDRLGRERKAITRFENRLEEKSLDTDSALSQPE
ncbi:tetratricopeptide repeat protein [Arhodomonas sp. AD133]|uniref:tetratricopeptide repeat protein n=1 Tax=Arhodomonas sp. AD133 TaxID=3415009 RepID=UPI003EB9AF3A